MPFSYRKLDKANWYVYLAVNSKNSKRYVGITSQGINQRWKQHCNAAGRGSECALHRAIRKYGESVFILKELRFFNNQNDAVIA